MIKTLCIALIFAAAVASPAFADTPITITVPLAITDVPATFNYVAIDCRLSTSTIAHAKVLGFTGTFATAEPDGGIRNGDPMGAAIYGIDLGSKTLALRKGAPVSPNITYTASLPDYGTPKNPFPYGLVICGLEGFKTSETAEPTLPTSQQTKSMTSASYVALPAY